MGQTVKVKLQEVTPLQGGLLLEVLSPPKPKRPGQQAPASRKGRSGPRGQSRGKVSSGPRHKGGKKKGGKR